MEHQEVTLNCQEKVVFATSLKWSEKYMELVFQGAELEIQDGEEIILGRDPQYCGLVFRNPKVSRRHCGIRYDGPSHQYQVIDYSSNGTRFVDGGVAKAGIYSTVPEGTVLIMGGIERIRLGG